MTKKTNKAINTSVDHPILIWLVSIVCILIAGLGAVMAVLNDQTVSELRALNSEIARLEDDRNRLREELESDEFAQLLAIRSQVEDLSRKQADLAKLEVEIAGAEERIASIDQFNRLLEIQRSKQSELQEQRRINTTEQNKLEQEQNDLIEKTTLIIERTRLTEEVKDLELEIKKLQDRRGIEKEQLSNFESDVREAIADRDKATKDARVAKDNKKAIEAEINDLREEKLTEAQLQAREKNLVDAEKNLKQDQDSLRKRQEELSENQTEIATEEINLRSAKQILEEDRAQYQLNLKQLDSDREKLLELEMRYRTHSESIQNALERINAFNNETAEQLEAVKVNPPQINFEEASARLQQAWTGLLDRFVENLIQNVQKEMKERSAPPAAVNEGTKDNTEEGN